MKWFESGLDRSATKARRAIDYLSKGGERPEKWAAVKQLLILISRKELTDDLIKDCIGLGWNKINYRIATNATPTHLQMLLDAELTDQKLFGIMIYNEALSKSQAQTIFDRCDDSERGYINRKQIWRKYGIGNELFEDSERT